MALDVGDGPQIPVEAKSYSIQFTPFSALYRNGNETALLLRTLSEFGDLQVTCDTSRLPALEDLDPEEAYLSWEIYLHTTGDEAAIREVFEFVEELCDLNISREEDGNIAPFVAANAGPASELRETATPEAISGQCEVITADLDDIKRSTMLESANDGALDQPKPEAPAALRGPASTVRVDVNRIDRLINLVGELVMNQAMLAQSASEMNVSAASEFASGLDELKQLSREIQDSVMAIRAQPVKSLFQRMSRIVREAAAATDKKVRLEITVKPPKSIKW